MVRFFSARLVGVVLVLAVAGLSIAVPSDASAALPFSINVALGAASISGTAPDAQMVRVSWRAADGRLKGRWTTRPHDGLWQTRSASYDVVERGDRILATQGRTTRRLRVPRLLFHVDRVADRIVGRGPPDATLDLQVYSPFGTGKIAIRSATHALGAFSVGLTGRYDILGGDIAQATWTDRDGDRVDAFVLVPFLVIGRGRAFVRGANWPGRTATINLFGRTLVLKATARANADYWGPFADYFRNQEGDNVNVAAGDFVDAPEIASDAHFVVPDVTVRAIAATDMVAGACPARLRFQIDVVRPGANVYGSFVGRATGTGAVRWDVRTTPDVDGRRIDLRTGDEVTLMCVLGTGDMVTRTVAVP